jgi:hypothetical protein
MHGTVEILRGLTAEPAEADDMVIVEDLRSKCVLIGLFAAYWIDYLRNNYWL